MKDPLPNPFEDPAEARTSDADGETSKLLKPWEDPIFDEHDVQSSYISGAFPGIVLAGCAYPLFLGSAIVFLGLVFGQISIGELPIALFFLALYSILGGVLGCIGGAILGLLSIALLIWMNRSVGYLIDARSAAISAGSLAGYAPTVWIIFTTDFGGGISETATAGFCGPILAMTLGSIGAAWSSTIFGGYELTVAKQRRSAVLSIKHIMMATMWIAITFAIANYFGGQSFAIAALAWFMLQGIVLGAIQVFRRMRKRKMLKPRQ